MIETQKKTFRLQITMSLTREDCYVGQKVVVVQKTKSNIGTIVKLNPKTAVVERDGFYRTRVPYSMLKRHEVAAPPQPPPLPTALEIENEKLKAEIEKLKADLKNITDKFAPDYPCAIWNHKSTETYEKLKAENEKLKAEIEKLKQENDGLSQGLIDDWEVDEKLKAENEKLKAENEKLRVEIVPLEIDSAIKSFGKRRQIREIIKESLLACLDVLTPFRGWTIDDEDVPDMMKHKADDLCDKFKVSRMIGMTLMKELFEVKDGVMVLRDD